MRRVLRSDDTDDGYSATTWATPRIQRHVGQRSAESRLRHEPTLGPGPKPDIHGRHKRLLIRRITQSIGALMCAN